VEVMPLIRFDPAEEYHQDYLEKNPGGYCHIDLDLAKKPLINPDLYPKRTKAH
jgi:peptide methionine sulfoxide reductase msrA/msrB